MAFQAVPDVASFKIDQIGGGGQDILNTVYVRNTGLAWSTGLLTTTATAIGNAWRDSVMPLLNNTSILDAVEGRDLGSEFGNFVRVEYNTAGSRVGQPASRALAAVVKLTGSSGGPPRQGRLFVGPLVDEDITSDDLSGTYNALLLTAMTAVDTAIAAAAAGNAWVIVSRYSKALNPTPPHARPVGVSNTLSGRSVRTVIGVQRDRRNQEGS